MKHSWFACTILGSLLFLTALAGAEEQDKNAQALPPITLDSDYTDWDHVPDTATFTRQFNPYYFNKEVKGTATALPISESVFWGYNGTRIREVKTLRTNTSIYFYLGTIPPVTNGLIYFMYIHKLKEKDMKNEYTIEVSVNETEGTGDILLWTYGVAKPAVIGKCLYDTKVIQGEVTLALLPEILSKKLVDFYSFDLTSCYFDKPKGIYEEFFYTTIGFKDIPTEEDL
jgi:hypothetical protein